MTTIRPFDVFDLFRFNNVNLDPLTETYGFNFYLLYLINWREYFQVCEHPNKEIMGYVMGKAEGHGENWHGHVTAVTVAPTYRRLRLAARMMRALEDISEVKNCYFVDLFVRVSNAVAINMYMSLGYVVFRRILDYYSGENEEDAFDMRKALSRDVERKSVIPLKQPVTCDEIDLKAFCCYLALYLKHSLDTVIDEGRRSRSSRFSIFGAMQCVTTVGATFLFLRALNPYISHSQRGKAIVGCAGLFYLSLANEMGWQPFSVFVAEKVRTKEMVESNSH
ncbi:hypothetical protein AB6A40_002664 [Gnathostoma spinigerum]|uniref:N-alpha-acetyltransferase 20 n=1 Tax=Gnathostoma spinigerum TaxID=75299 RepID=A0ABD6E8E5_9BILA